MSRPPARWRRPDGEVGRRFHWIMFQPDVLGQAALHHPLVGDPLYGADPTLASRVGLVRQWLHAMELSFVHPATGDEVRFVSQYPADLQAALEALRGH